ncbi:MAG: hypothetical protein R2730_15475 [Chitinophagales bacterium]
MSIPTKGYMIGIFLLLLIPAQSSKAAIDELTKEPLVMKASYEPLDRETWEELVDKADYWKNEKEKEKEEKKEPVKYKSMGEMDLGFLKYVFVGLAILLIVYILLRVFAAELFESSKKIKTGKGYTLENLESNLAEAPLQKLLREAIENREYKLAVRVYYLIILQSLNERKLIQWHKEKTNASYLNEMRAHINFREFRLITNIFEHIWYGADLEISSEQFSMIQPAFDDFIKVIEK